ncbi:MAG: glycosyltransferase [Kouleothrix sp.]
MLRDAAGGHDTVIFLYEQYCDANGLPRPVSDAMLADLFRLADALLFPSAYEGFGIPIIEAELAGIPIFCSDIAPFREYPAMLPCDLGSMSRPLPSPRIAQHIAGRPALRYVSACGWATPGMRSIGTPWCALRKSSSSPLRCTRTYKTTS